MPQRFLVDIVHPAHFHFYRHLIVQLEARGAEVMVATRDKDVTGALVSAAGLAAVEVSSIRGSGRVSQARELLQRDVGLARLVRRFRPDVMLTRNPTGVHAALTRRSTFSIFDTDDGTAAGLHYRLARPAGIITMPEGVDGGGHPRIRRYDSFKALAYLHPNRLVTRDVRAELGRADAPLFVIRTVAMAASHDHGESGIPPALLGRIIELLSSRGRVVVSCEGDIPAQFAHLRSPLPPSDFHSLLATADLVVGDSQTVATEAALLGTPVVHVSSWSRRLSVLIELEDRWRLLESFRPDSPLIIEAIERLSVAGNKAEWLQRKHEMLANKVDLTDWYLDLIDSL